ncbi:sialate:H+ symport family MFS transporter [Streptomyces sp. NPDC018019]|uniref:sialate:H+ symport family MFS transporter n=1 Tax=Streptomyces sp. NPDC018019 TaxID=3365030 RepID=UPI0037B1ED8E
MRKRPSEGGGPGRRRTGGAGHGRRRTGGSGHGRRTPWYRQVTPRQWKSLFAAWVGYLLDGFDFVLITLVLTEIADTFGLSTAGAASLVSGAFITRWLGGALLGALGDRHGRRAAMITSILLYSLGTFACGFAWDYTSLFTARLVVGMGMAGEYSASATYVLESWPAPLRNRASGFLISGYAGGTVLAAQLYQWVVPHWGWRWMFWIGVLPVLVALWVRRSLPEAGDWSAEVGAAGVRPDPFRPLFAGRARRRLNGVLAAVASAALFCVFTPVGAGHVPWLAALSALCLTAFAVQLGGRRGWVLYVSLTVTVFCAFLYSWPVQALLPTYLKTELGYAPAQVADVLFYAGFGTMAGCWLAGFTGDRFGTRRAYAGTLLASLAFVFPVFAVRVSLVALGVLLFGLLALGQGISGILPKYIAGHFPTAVRAASLGFVYNVGALGGAVAPVLGARLAEGMSLGRALAVLTFGLTLVVIVLVGGDVPVRLARLLDRGVVGDHLVPGGADGAVGRRP